MNALFYEVCVRLRERDRQPDKKQKYDGGKKMRKERFRQHEKKKSRGLCRDAETPGKNGIIRTVFSLKPFEGCKILSLILEVIYSFSS